jgi:hypothetical protein
MLLLRLTAVIIAAIKGIRQYLFGCQIPFLNGYNCRKQGIGVTFMRRLHLDMGDQINPTTLFNVIYS